MRQYLEDEGHLGSDYLNDRSRFFFGSLIVAWAVWLFVGLISGGQPIETNFRLFGSLVMTVPWQWPRETGLLWYALLGAIFLFGEHRSLRQDELDDGEGFDVGGWFWAWLLSLALGYGLASLIGRWAGAWPALGLTIVVAWCMGDFVEGGGLRVFFGLGLCAAAAVGIWTGFFAGFYHGLLCVFVSLVSMLSRVKPHRQSDALPRAA